MMKILFLTRLYLPHVGGVETHVHKLTEDLVNQGHQVTLLTSQFDPELPLTQDQQGSHIVRVPYHLLDSKLKIWSWLLQHQQLITIADIIQAHDITWWYFPLKLLHPHQPIYTTFHGWEGIYPIPNKSIIWHRLAELVSSGNICIGDYINRWYGTKPNFVSYGATNCLPHPPVKKPHIVVLGRLSTDNDLPIILEALTQVKKSRSVNITFVGDGELASQAQKIGKVTGFINDTHNYINKASVVIASSYLSILDSMAIGRPVISVYSNAVKKDYLHLHPKHQHISINSNSQQLTAAINQALANNFPQSPHIQQAQTWALKQTWAKLTNQYLELWQKN